MPKIPKAKEAEDKVVFTDPLLQKYTTSNNDEKSVLFSREEGDTPILTDAMFNFVAGSSFEIGASLAILDNPGAAGYCVDDYAKQVERIIDKIYSDPALGGKQILLTLGGKPITLRQYFDTKILKELSPLSDQIGRCQDKSKAEGWFTGGGREWLSNQLKSKSDAPSYNYTNMLTKVRTISAFGTILREMMPWCKDTLEVLLEKDVMAINARNAQIAEQIRHDAFDSPTTRSRTEKMPIIEGTPLSSFDAVAAKTTDAGPLGLGFGKVWHSATMGLPGSEASKTEEELARAEVARREVIDKYNQLESAEGRQGMPRVGQDMKDPELPGLLGESSQALIPKAFQATGLQAQIDDHRFAHGSGLNRWQLTGSYPRASWDKNMPAAGAHSGGTSDIFLALNCLGDESIFGKEAATSVGLVVSSFMNFGGYHSFVETFPIAQAIAQDATFTVDVTNKQRGLYQEIAQAVSDNCADQVCTTVNNHLAAYQHTFSEIKEVRNKTGYLIQPPVLEESGLESPGIAPQPEPDRLAESDVAIATREQMIEALLLISNVEDTCDLMIQMVEQANSTSSVSANGSTDPNREKSTCTKEITFTLKQTLQELKAEPKKEALEVESPKITVGGFR